MAPLSVSVDITGRVPLQGAHHIGVWVFLPDKVSGRLPLLFCLPGGSYTKAYWHLEVPGRAGYSFGEYLAARGMVVTAIDHIGVGDSSRHLRATELTPDVVATANSAALATLLERLRSGTLVDTVGAMDVGPVVGVGHSMGAMLAIFQQSLHADFAAIAPLGYGVIGPWGGARGLGLPTYESIMGPARHGAFDQPFTADRSMPTMRHHFYWDDVPADVIASDDLSVTHLPGVTGPLSIVPFIAADHAGRVTCPVFIGFGERDSTISAYHEPSAYTSSKDVTLFVLERSAHCHNSAGTRHVLWERLARWVRTLPER